MMTITTSIRWLGMLATILGYMASTAAAQAPATSAGVSEQMLVYIGTYASKDEDGIYVYQMDMNTGGLTRIGGISGIKNPSFQALHPNKSILYSVSESQDFQDTHGGAVSAFAIDDRTGMLTLLNETSSLGADPCHVSTDHAGNNLLVANYSSGSVAVLPIKSDGSLEIAHNLIQHTGSSIHARQKSPHAHCINNDAHDNFVVSADLGLDKILIYRLNSDDHALTPNPEMPAATVQPGSGPRHFTFHPNGKFGYVINELNSTVTAFSYDADRGTLSTIHNVSTLPAGFTGENTTAEIAIAPDGRFLYGSNRGHNSIVVFAIDPTSGKLTFVSHHRSQGKQPRNFGIDPTGSFLLAANQTTGNVVVFKIDRQSGTLSATGHSIALPKPVCVTFLQQ